MRQQEGKESARIDRVRVLCGACRELVMEYDDHGQGVHVVVQAQVRWFVGYDGGWQKTGTLRCGCQKDMIRKTREMLGIGIDDPWPDRKDPRWGAMLAALFPVRDKAAVPMAEPIEAVLYEAVPEGFRRQGDELRLEGQPEAPKEGQVRPFPGPVGMGPA